MWRAFEQVAAQQQGVGVEVRDLALAVERQRLHPDRDPRTARHPIESRIDDRTHCPERHDDSDADTDRDPQPSLLPRLPSHGIPRLPPRAP